MNRLRGMTAYLCGAMDRVDDGGTAWREYITPKLQELGVGVFNPCNKPSNYAPEDEDTRELISSLKVREDYDGVSKIMKPICAVDLRMVDIAHFIVMSLDVDSHLCGSYHEAFVAIGQKKPVVVMCKQGKKNLPNWLFGAVPHQMVFSNWSESLEYLYHINEDEHVEHLNRWRFFNFNKVYGNDQSAIRPQELYEGRGN
jgi:hypothetical protein